MTHQRNTLLVLILVLVPLLWSQEPSDSVTLKGRVGETTLLSNNDLHIWLQNGNSGSEVCLGQAQVLRDQGLLPDVGDTLEVTGTRIGNRGVLRANTLQMAGKILVLDRTCAGRVCPGCDGHNCNHRNCGAYGHACNHGHHGHYCGHE